MVRYFVSANAALILVAVLILSITEKAFAEGDALVDDNSKLLVYADDYPPYSFLGADGVPAGSATERVRRFLDSTGIEYEIKILPWARAMREATTQSNSLIFSLNRTKEREDEFFWVLPLNTSEYYLFARDEDNFKQMSEEDVRAASGRAVCEKNSSQCAALRSFGFTGDRIWEISSPGHPALTTLVLRGRADYIVAAKAVIELEVRQSSLDNVNLVPLFQVNSVTDFLAAYKSFDKELLEDLMRAAEDFTMTESR